MRGVINNTPLHDAALYTRTSCMRVLLRIAPHLLNAVDEDNETPLTWAVMYDSRDAAKILLRAGADVRLKNHRSVFDIARARNNEEILEILKQHQQVSGIF